MRARVDPDFPPTIPAARSQPHRAIQLLLLTGALLTLWVCQTPSWGQGKSKPRRAAPPKWDDKEVRKIFFDNLFDGTVLVGERPSDFSASSSKIVKSNVNPTGGSAGGSANSSNGTSGWAAIIESSVIEDEVKAMRMAVDETVTTPTDFAGKGHKPARMQFTTLAMLFGISSEFESDVRWKSDAASARDAFARAAANAKAGGNAQVFAEAKARKQDLQSMISGSGFPNKTNSEAKTNWSQTCSRTPLMQRLEMSQAMRMQPWTADKGSFKANKDKLLHEAQIVAAISEVLSSEGMEDAEASEYKAFCEKLKKAAIEVIEATKLDNDEVARKGVGDINASCDLCHGAYRS